MPFDRLIIAEKPSVGRAIASNLGGPQRPVKGAKGPTHIVVGTTVVTWLFGHVLEQMDPEGYDESFKSWWSSADRLPIVPQEWKLKPIESSREQLGVIRDLVKESALVVHAGDPDREGQLLVDEVLHYLRNRKPVQRLLLNALDDGSVKKALGNLKDNAAYLPLYNAALGRQRADWLVGMNFTRAATVSNQRSGNKGTLSIGRVQTPTLAMIVKRDEEIANFTPVAYFALRAQFQHTNGTYAGRWKPKDDQPGLDSEGRLLDATVARDIAAAVDGQQGHVAEYKVESASQSPPLPFSLSALQSKASSQFGMSAQEVLEICQRLYETHKVASYPRTDCQYLPTSQHAEAPDVLTAIGKVDPGIAQLVGGAAPTLKSKAWNDAKVSAHHGIVPTANANYSGLTGDERKVFMLIVKSYLAQFYPDFTYEQTSVLTECGGERFASSGRTPVDFGWRKVYGAEKEESTPGKEEEEDDQLLPSMVADDAVDCTKLEADKKQTKAPQHYTEGTLIRAMTNVHELVDDPELKKKLKAVKGIGTEATRAAIIETLKKRGFVTLSGKKIVSTSAGRQFIHALPRQLTDVGLTAQWENLLDRIEAQTLDLDRYLGAQVDWVTKLTHRLLASTMQVGVGMKPADLEARRAAGVGSACPKCGTGTLRLRQAKQGRNAGDYFLGCSGYPDCKTTVPIEDQAAIKAGEARSQRSA